jgi:Sporulation related domain.
MKWLFLALLTVNLGFFFWHYKGEVSESAPLTQARHEAPCRGATPKSLLLLSEVEPGGEQEQPPARALPESRPLAWDSARPEQARAHVCYALGPFYSDEALTPIKHSLEALELKSTRESRKVRARIGYWVYLPPLESRAAALELTREFTARGVTDYLVITAPDKRNAISLGIYSDRSKAERRHQDLKALGYSPIVEERYKEQVQYWINFTQPIGDDVTRHLLDDWKAKGEELQRVAVDCPF